MNIPAGTHETIPPPMSDDEREEMFLKLFCKLNDFAIDLGGDAWQQNQVFNVGTERTGKYPTSEEGIADQDAYYIETVSFVAEKCKSGDPDCPFFNAFYLTQTVSTPIEIDEADPDHHERLFDHFLQFFPNVMKEMIDSLAGPINSGILMEPEETDLDEISPEVRFDIISQAVGSASIPFRLGETVTYAILENGQIIQFATNKTYEIGATEYPLVSFDSSDDPFRPVHAPANDKHAVEFIEDPDEKVDYPAREKLADDPVEQTLLEHDFYDLVGEAFGEEDHAAIPYAQHVHDIKRILKKLRRAA
jgi:hypothetical protein